MSSLSSSTRVPVSQLLHDSSENVDDEPKKKSREDWRKAKELEEARKAGTAPAAVDEEGRDINPHIPQYISAAPWYYNSAGPTLKHQRPQEENKSESSAIDEWYKRGVDTSQVVTKFRKGACDNCGAMTHKKIDCMERPRKIGAKFTGAVVAHDEFIQPKIISDYDGKRDRWGGYDPAAHREIVEEFQKIEEAKQKLKAEKLKESEEGAESGEESGEDEDKYVDGVDMPGTKVDSKQRITVRNLRIREDTAKYLRNLDPNSAYYDPKTRSMRDNPNPATNPNETDFAGENFVRFSGDTNKHATAQMFAWEAHGKGVDVHLLAEPTKLEILQKEYESKKEQYKSQTKGKVLEKYGGEEHLEAPAKSLLLAQTEEYVEYSRSGKVIKGQEKQINRSRYEEDVLINNHTCVWGSYWTEGRWGFKCCHSFIKNSYCVGETGKQIAASSMIIPSTSSVGISHPVAVPAAEPDSDNGIDDDDDDNHGGDKKSDDSDEEAAAKSKRSKKKKKKNKKHKKNKKSEKDELEKALEAEKMHSKMVEKLMSVDERKRPYNSMYDVKKPTDAEVEAYLMKRRREDDPMAQFTDK